MQHNQMSFTTNFIPNGEIMNNFLLLYMRIRDVLFNITLCNLPSTVRLQKKKKHTNCGEGCRNQIVFVYGSSNCLCRKNPKESTKCFLN